LDAFRSFLPVIGLDPGETVRWDLPITDEAHTFAAHHLPGDQPTLLISPCSSHPRRNWHAAGYAAVADHAVRQQLPQIEGHLAKFGDSLPDEIRNQFEALKERLG
jgi:ADP-heptose:LPS heptosyltransferase